MSSLKNQTTKKEYQILLQRFIETQDEQYLYQAEQVSKLFLKDRILPEEIVDLHNQTLQDMFPDLPEQLKNSMSFLLETMISYGLAHQEYQTLREEQLELKSEISVAASMQETFLRTEKPQIKGLDIGVISVPAHQMNGDYHHFIKGEDGSLGVAVADVVGKGVPAALCMSMIKYSIDSYPSVSMRPKSILENLNRVVERNIDPSMFITMFYGHYTPNTSTLHYASAGHEPGLYYEAKSNTFKVLETKGIVLGVAPDASYAEFELTIEEDDLIILLTDGVTECRRDGEFLELEEVIEVIRIYKDLPPSEIVKQVYKHFERLQNFQLRDDFTMIILKKQV